MLEYEKFAFDTEGLLATSEFGRTIIELRDKRTLFLQRESGDSAFYRLSDCATLTVAARNARETTIVLLSAGESAVDASLARTDVLHSATTTINGFISTTAGRYQMVATFPSH